MLDYRIPGKNGLQIAKEIFKLNPEQRIIFASAYVKETLEDSVKELKRVVELMQKPFDIDVLVDTIDKEAQEGVRILMRNLSLMNKNIGKDDDDHAHRNDDKFKPSLEQLRDLFASVRRNVQGRNHVVFYIRNLESIVVIRGKNLICIANCHYLRYLTFTKKSL